MTWPALKDGVTAGGKGTNKSVVQTFFFYKLFMYLYFIFGCPGCCCAWAFSYCCLWGLLFKCRVQASHCSGFSCYRAQALRHTDFSSWSSWAQKLQLPGSKTGSVAVVHRLSGSETRGIFPDQRLSLCLLHWQVDSCPLSHQGSPVVQTDR